MKREMVHVAYILHDADGRYSKFVGTSAASLLRNTKSHVMIHLIHDDTLTTDNREKFIRLVKSFGQYISFYNMDVLRADDMRAFLKSPDEIFHSERFSVGTLYRYFVADLLPTDVDRVILLDADTIVNLDIEEMYATDTGASEIAAVPEWEAFYRPAHLHDHVYVIKKGLVSREAYFNTGVMLMNLVMLRKFASGRMAEESMEFLRRHPDCTYPGQTAMNYFFAKNYHRLPVKYNTFVVWERLMGHTKKLSSCIYHYAAYMVGLSPDIFNDLFWENFIRTPWCEPLAFWHLLARFNEELSGERKKLLSMSSLFARKKRAVCAHSRNQAPLAGLLRLAPDETFIALDAPDGMNRLLTDMRSCRGAKVYMIFADGFSDMKKTLEGAGFSEGEDFIDGLSMLGEEHGVKAPEYPFVKCM